MEDSQKIQIGGKAAVVVVLILIVGVVIRLAAFSHSTDSALEKKVRAQLWMNYGSQLGKEIDRIKSEGDYGSASSLTEKAKPAAIVIKQISYSKPLLFWSSSQDAIVRVHYRFPDDTKTRTKYMRFNHSVLAGWIYRRESTVLSYYMNFW